MGKLLYRKLKKYLVESSLIVISVLIAVVSVTTYRSAISEERDEDELIVEPGGVTGERANIHVDLSGAVKNPGLYKAPNGSRLNSIIEMGGGLSDTADKQFFSRNFNLARIMNDQDKIYIPSEWELGNGIIMENGQLQNMSQPTSQTGLYTAFIDLNLATLEELDTLPGVGKITAQKIVDNRPFKALEELITKKIVSNNVFNNIKNLIGL